MPSFSSRVCACVRSGKDDGAYANALLPDLSIDASTKLGQAFGLVTAEADAKSGDALVALLEDAIGRAAEEVAARALGESRDALIEQLVAKVNQRMEPVFAENGLAVERSTVSATLAFVDGRTLFAMLWGYPHAMLLRNPGGEDGTVFDLVAESRVGEQSPAARDRFAEIISGPLSAKDRVVLASHDLLETLARDKVLSSVGANRGDAAASALADLLMAYAGVDSAAIIVAGEPSYGSAPGTVAQPKTSMDSLLGTASRTNDILSPSILRPMGRKISAIMQAAMAATKGRSAKPGRRAPEAAPAEEPREERMAMTDESATVGDEDLAAEEPRVTNRADRARNDGPSLWSGVAASASSMGKRAAGAIGSGVRSLADGKKRNALLATFKGDHGSYADAAVARWNALTQRGKAALIGLMAVILVANGLGLASVVRGAQERRVADYENRVAAARQKIDAAESSLIYNDYARAKTLLDEAEKAAAELPTKTPEEQRVRRELDASLARQRQAMRREVPLAAATVLATVPDSGAHLGKMALYKNAAWVAAVDGSVYSFVLKDGKELKKAEASLGAAPAYLAATGSNGLVVGDAGGKTVRVSDAGKGKAATLDGIPDLAATDAEVYGSSLYVLDASHNRILKYPILDDGFGKATLSIKDGTDVGAGQALAIDGSIFTVSGDGTARKMTKGARDPFVLQETEPALRQALSARAAETSDALYVLEPGRILKYSRTTGRFINQFTSAELATATDFLVDEKAKTIIVTAGARLLKFPLP
jgi:hypothetical protein